EWYTAQIIQSDLPFQTLSYWSGQVGEIIVGIIFLILFFFKSKFPPHMYTKLFYIGNILIFFMMMIAFYVHLHPNVSSDVLPLKIKHPYIPGIFLFFAMLNIFLKIKK